MNYLRLFNGFSVTIVVIPQWMTLEQVISIAELNPKIIQSFHWQGHDLSKNQILGA